MATIRNIIIIMIISSCSNPIKENYIPIPEDECVRESECKYA